MGHDFDLPLDNLPSNVKKIKIYSDSYDLELNNLPTSLELLKIPPTYKLLIKHYPNLQILICGKLHPQINDFKKKNIIIINEHHIYHINKKKYKDDNENDDADDNNE